MVIHIFHRGCIDIKHSIIDLTDSFDFDNH